MEQALITFQADEQRLVKTGGLCQFINGTYNYIYAQFTLGTNWTEFDSVRALWWFGSSDPIPTVLDHEGKCEVPAEFIQARGGELHVNLVGSVAVNGALVDRLTTVPVIALIISTKRARVNGIEPPITPSQFEQFVSYVKADADRAEGSAQDAEAWAIGERDGTPVADTDETYHNNAKYYSEVAHDEATDANTAKVASQTAQGKAEEAQGKAETAESNSKAQALKSEGYATGRQNGQYVSSDSPYYHDNAKYYKDQAEAMVGEITNLTAEATTLAPDQEATASYDSSTGVLSLGIPQGIKGNVMYATFEVNESTGVLSAHYPDEYDSATFSVDSTGHLLVEV